MDPAGTPDLRVCQGLAVRQVGVGREEGGQGGRHVELGGDCSSTASFPAIPTFTPVPTL